MTGAGMLLRHFLRRDRWMLLAWSIGITVLYWSQAVSVKGLYATRRSSTGPLWPRMPTPPSSP